MHTRPKSLLLRLLALLLAVTLLAACGAGGSDEPQPTAAPQAPVPDSEFELQPADGETPLNGGGAVIAMAVDETGVEHDGRNAAVWQGVQKFAADHNFSAQVFAALDASPAARTLALQEASQSGASMVVCAGESMAEALYTLQNEYPTVGYLMIDAEPHNGDYSDYSMAANTHCVLFDEEQAGFLAGYAAVMEGFESIGVVGTEAMPQIVRYATGFIQGADAAAVQQGVHVICRTWYSGQEEAGEQLAEYVSHWYQGGVQTVFAVGGDMARGCVDAVELAGTGTVMGADWDRSDLGDTVLASTVKGYSRAAQQALFAYYGAGGIWDEAGAGKTARLGVQDDAVALSETGWRLTRFTAEEYGRLYQNLRNGEQTVEAYSDTLTQPPTVNVEIWAQNT